MEGYDASTYGDKIAGIYDDLYGTLFDVEATVELLSHLAHGEPALELAVGTGRIALPLAAAGVEVTGIDISEEMVARLRSKPGGEDIPVVIGDFADVDVEGAFGLVYLVFNTLFALTTQENQVRCFDNVAKRLSADGVFVVEAFVPDITRFDGHQRTGVEEVTVDEVHLEASRHDPVRQTIDTHHVVLKNGAQVELYPVFLRYAYPAELDLMARLAGLRLRNRWGGWHKEPFTSDSRFHVSVYERA